VTQVFSQQTNPPRLYLGVNRCRGTLTHRRQSFKSPLAPPVEVAVPALVVDSSSTLIFERSWQLQMFLMPTQWNVPRLRLQHPSPAISSNTIRALQNWVAR
jgi:hypothetical protein